MTEWVWTIPNFIRGKGQLATSSGLFSRAKIELLRFTFDGRFLKHAEVSEFLREIIEEDIESWKAKRRFLPVAMLEIINRGLWKIKIRKIRSIRMNDKILTDEDYFFDICHRVHAGDNIISLNATIETRSQQVKLNFRFRDKRVNGEMVFQAPISERSVNKFTEQLTKLKTLFEHQIEETESDVANPHYPVVLYGTRLDRDVNYLESMGWDHCFRK